MEQLEKAEPTAAGASRARHIPIRSISVAIVMAVALYAGMASLTDRHGLLAAISALPSAIWGQVAILSLLSYLFRFARWHHFMCALGHSVPLHRHLRIYLAAFALTLTPGKAGETIRSVYLHPYGVGYPHSIGAFVSERLLDLVAVGALAALASALFPQQRLWMGLALACIAGVTLLLRSRLLSLIGARLAKGSAATHATQAVAAIRFMLSGRRLAVAAPLSLMAWAAQGISLYLIVHTLGYDLPASTVVAIYCLSILAGAASFIPGGLGATEAALVLLLSAAGVGETDAFTASLVSRSLTLWLAVGVGMMAMTGIALAEAPQARRASGT